MITFGEAPAPKLNLDRPMSEQERAEHLASAIEGILLDAGLNIPEDIKDSLDQAFIAVLKEAIELDRRHGGQNPYDLKSIEGA